MGQIEEVFISAAVRLYDWYLAHRNTFDLLGLFLSVAGTMFAVLSIRDGKKLTDGLRSVFDHLTTKEIGSFPAYLAEVDRIVREGFWDPKLNGVDWKTAVARAARELAAARTAAERDAVYDTLLAGLQDSHTFRVQAGRIPPRDWGTAGLRIGAQGEGYVITGVIPGSPADRAGLRGGSQQGCAGAVRSVIRQVPPRDGLRSPTISAAKDYLRSDGTRSGAPCSQRAHRS